MTYLDRPVWDFRPDFNVLSHSHEDDHTFDSVGTGAATPWKPTTKLRRRVKFPYLLHRGSTSVIPDLNAVVDFIADRAGPRRGFWLPMWVTDYEPVEDVAAGETEIDVRAIGLTIAGFEQFSHLFIATADKLELYSIESVGDAVDGVQTVTLGEVLETDMDASKSVIGGLLYVRLTDDEQTYSFTTTAVARATFSFVELPTEYVTAYDGEMPIYIYEITRGTGIWRYANHGLGVKIGANTYDPQNITNDGLRFGIDFLSEETRIHVGTDSATHPFRFYTNSLALGVTEVTIYEVDGDTPPSVLPTAIHSGRVGEVDFVESGKIEVALSSYMRISEANTPRQAISRRCMHRLGDEWCQKDLTSFTTVGVVTVVADGYIEADEFGDKATAEADANWFVFGQISFGTEQRFCTGQAGNRLYLNAPFQAVIVGSNVTAIAGCDKKIQTCDTKFSNRERHVGYFYIPSQNPQFKALQTPLSTGGKK